MSLDPKTGLSPLLAHPNFVNKELHFKLGGPKIFALLAEDEPLSRLAAPNVRPQADNLAAFYHLNLLQYGRPEAAAAVEADLLAVRAANVGALSDIVLDLLTIPAAVLEPLAATLTDLWLLDSTGVRKVTLCMNAIKDAGLPTLSPKLSLGVARGPAVVVAANLARAAFLYGIDGYLKLVLEAGRVIERLVSST
ncbi:MAG TPA: hypothetical protein VN961_21880, partial [Streptosporangiaceae bacterium]|nr:hypothetical protein [Streptosporangiaceae bacterium]